MFNAARAATSFLELSPNPDFPAISVSSLSVLDCAFAIIAIRAFIGSFFRSSPSGPIRDLIWPTTCISRDWSFNSIARFAAILFA